MSTYISQDNLLNIALIVAVFGLLIAILADHMQLLAKYEGAVQRKVAGGYNLAMKVMVANRVGAVLYFLCIAVNVDHGLSPQTLALYLAVAVAAAALPTVLMLIWLQRRINALGFEARVLDTTLWPRKIVIAAFIATAFNLLGLTAPWIAGATYPDLRLTLANTSFLFNTIFTIVNVFYIEHHFARLIDQNKIEIHGFVAGVIVLRLAAFLCIGATLALLA